MTTGEQLKRKLGLQKINHVRINRALIATKPTYYIWIDSAHPDGMVTNSRISQSPQVVSIFGRGEFGDTVRFSPLIDIEEYNGSINKYIFIVVDLAGERYINPYFRENIKYKGWSLSIVGKLTEFVKLSDLKFDGMSDFTKGTRSRRNKAQGVENRLAKLIDFSVDVKENWVMFYWLTDATTNIYDPEYQFKNTDVEDNFSLEKNDSKLYTMQIKILDFFNHLKQLKISEDHIITWEEIKLILEEAYVQVWSDAPSFHWQGMNYWISQLDGSIYPTDIKPKRWNNPKLHGDGNAFVDKHLGGLLNQMGFFLNQMASMATSRLKKRGLL